MTTFPVSVPDYTDPHWSSRSIGLHRTLHRLITLILRSGVVSVRVGGLDEIPERGPAVLMSNHESNVDPFLIGYVLSRPMWIPGKASLFGVPLLGWMLRNIGSYPVDREAADVGSLRTSIEVLRSGRLLTVFPEARRSRTGDILPFSTTLVKLAIRQRVPIVPVGLAGTADLLPPGRVVPRLPAALGSHFGHPVDVVARYGTRPSEAQIRDAAEELRGLVVEERERARTLIRSSGA
ncbi:MAG TPA: lysophospholipid acyltransferase family protein [Chloroflexota bacterium]|nr:lysophospholipid acyltransferase family protein [Chloroflexota bacterium]